MLSTCIRVLILPRNLVQPVPSQLPRPSVMTSDSQRQEGRDSTLSRLNLAIDALSIAKDISTIAPARAAFGSACALLTIIRVFFSCYTEMNFLLMSSQDFMANKEGYVELGLHCADICKAIDRRMNGKRLDDLSRSVCEAINQLTTWVQLDLYGFVHPPMTRLITEPLRRSRGRPQNRVGAAAFPDFSIRRTTRKRLLLGSQNSTGSFRSLMCVEPLLLCRS